jgi:hypothetical protein
MYTDHVYEDIEISTFRNDQGENSSSNANAVYARAAILGQYNDYDYIPGERNNRQYVFIEIIFK